MAKRPVLEDIRFYTGTGHHNLVLDKCFGCGSNEDLEMHHRVHSKKKKIKII